MATSDTETLQTSTHHIANSIAWLLSRVLGLLFLLDTIFVVFIAISIAVPNDYATFSLATLWVLFTIKFIIIVILITRLLVQWGSVQYYLDKARLIRYRGFLRRDEDIYDLHNLKTVTLHQGWLGRRFNYGDLEVVVASSGYKEEVWMTGIFNPKKYERALREYLTAD